MGTQMKPAVTPERIFSALNAYQVSAALKTAVELDLFTAIAEGATAAAEIALRCNSSERGCRILCDFLAINGLLTKNDGRYGLTQDAAIFLDRNSPAYLGTVANFLASSDMIGYFNDLTDCVRTGTTALPDEGTVKSDNPLWINFARNMAPLMAGAAMDIAAIVNDGKPCKVLDIAAGHGLFGIAIAQANPNANIVALDWAAVLEVATENAVKAGVADRHSTIAGSAFEAEYGAGYDLVLITNFIHHFDRATSVSFLKKVRAALKPGGRAVTLEMIPNEDRVTPPVQAAFPIIMLVDTKGGDAYTFAELESMFSEAGFASSEMRDLQHSPERLVISVA